MLRLYDYWSSSSAYRVRIALGLKGLPFERVVVRRLDGIEDRAYGAVNPQGFVPTLEVDGQRLIQSAAILEYLEERHPVPPLLPADLVGRARVRAMAQLVVADIQPLNNQRVQDALTGEFGFDRPTLERWYARWIAEGLAALERMVAEGCDGSGDEDGFCYGPEPGMADICLVPQLFNARRWRCNLDPYPRLRRIEVRCAGLPAFAAARPEAQADCPE